MYSRSKFCPQKTPIQDTELEARAPCLGADQKARGLCFIGSCHVGVLKRFARSISLAVFCLYIVYFGLSDLL